MPPKTTIERSPSSSPDVTVFKIAGVLGFHQKETLEKLFGECKKRSLNRVVLDVGGLTSLGGGCAKIIREEAESGGLVLGIAAAKTTVRKFLKDSGHGLVLTDSVEDAIASVLDLDTDAGAEMRPAPEPVDEALSEHAVPDGDIVAPEPPTPDDPAAENEPAGEEVLNKSDDDLVNEDTLDEVLRRDDAPEPAPEFEAEPAVESEPDPEPRPEPATDDTTTDTVDIPLEFAQDSGPEPPAADCEPESEAAAATEERPPVEAAKPGPGSNPAAAGPVPESVVPTAPPMDQTRQLKKRIVQYNTLLSINGDFGRIHDRKSLLETFLLTTIAQVGVESAVFLERNSGYFYPTSMKGLEAEEVRGLALQEGQLGLEGWQKAPDVHRIDEAPFTDDARAPLLAIGCRYVAPFVSRGEFKGIVLLGKPIKNDLDENTIEFLKILINQAAIAYESTSMLEEENKRTLGLVHTLISLIEENTLARGNTNLLSNYVYALARAMHVPDDGIRDLMYGTVLRDIGMIKVSDLIVRSPRELMPEEWEVIKRHPIDGADMLRNMRFSDGAVNVVLCHHERFNGEGYPGGLQGNQIPLGARIVSVVESYAAMLQDRPTRPALSEEDALNTLRENWGMRYDPEVVRHFVEIVENEIRTGASVADKKFELFQV